MSNTIIIENIRDIIKSTCESFLSHIIEKGFDEEVEFEEYYKEFSEDICSTRKLRYMRAVQELEKMLSPPEQKEEKKKRKTKSKTEENKPKKPLNAYLIFCKENQKTIREQNSDLGAKDVMRKMGEIWKSLDTDEKKKYSDRATSDKERYNKEMEGFKPEPNNEIEEKKDTKIEKPKKAPTAYNNFCKQKTQELKQLHPDRKSSENLKEASRMWKDLSDEEKEKYKNMGDEEKNKEKDKKIKPKKIMKKITHPHSQDEVESDDEPIANFAEKKSMEKNKNESSKPKKIMKKIVIPDTEAESDDELVDE